ncbi:CPBP family intramembrane glutamic endopeptidase [Microbacter margulisiae]|uniref:Membrane protease YdiL (CAAX protease family) n=1 Tax=Microbacter margulisiae TaxID=1350067 RepID=A0A7W5H3S2_9PORP|nr:CPBP family intramembrane glutamic endopeptidase [Microbacter margulisiae]MBB3188736.1 membrane protease YdiL (CAAX protease family) [Microbacter margulisiae]
MRSPFPFNLNSVVPYRQDPNRKKWTFELGRLLKAIVFLIIIYFILVIISSLILNHAIMLDVKRIYDVHMEKFHHFFGDARFSLIALLLAPILEELAFRFGLTFEKRKIILAIPLMLLITSVSEIYMIHFTLVNIIKISLLIVFYLVMWKKTNEAFWLKVKDRYGNLIIYMFILIFTIGHLNHLTPLVISQAPYYGLFILPLFIFGLILTYIRLRFGILYSMAAHILWNLVMISFLIK